MQFQTLLMLNIQKGPKYFLFLTLIFACQTESILKRNSLTFRLQASQEHISSFQWTTTLLDCNSSITHLMKDHILQSTNTQLSLINIKKQNCTRHTDLSKPAMLPKLLLKMFYPNFTSTHTIFINSYVVTSYS
jgi:hypothetical protein|uniref:Uncharacterized protein n=1 Tax=Zea mays TaxID=4577 RepID=A0A804NAJ1_MAIZE